MAVRFLPLDPGDPTEVAGYALRARLGSGGMGTVYLSFSRGGRPVAIKVVRREFADDPEFRRRFAREIAAAQQVQGHFTAPVVDASPDAPLPWLATAYIAGPSLQTAVGEHGPFPLFTVFRLLAGAAEGIAAVHAAGLIHRDLKPANVLLAEDGPRVIDFGIAHAANSSTLTGKGSAVGTPGYMAPEQIRGKVSQATDVFGLGQLAVYAATGHPAFGEGTTETLFYRILNEPPDLDDCPAELRPIAERCLAKAPADRPSVTEVIDFARGAMRGDTMRVVGEPWLPAPVAETFPAYAPDAAPPPPRPVLSPPRAAPSTVVPVTGRPGTKRNRGLLRSALTVAAAVLLVVGGYLGYELGRSGGSSSAPSSPPAGGTPAVGPPPASKAPPTAGAASSSPSVPSTASPATAATPASTELSALTPLQSTTVDQLVTNRPQQVGAKTYANAVRFSCSSDSSNEFVSYNDLVYDVAGYTTFQATFGVPDDASNGTGNSATITFYKDGSTEMGSAYTVSLDDPATVDLPLNGISQLDIRCLAANEVGRPNPGDDIDVAIVNGTLS